MASPIPLLFGAYKRSGFPEATTVNCMVEAAQTKPNQPQALIARPGLEAFKTVGTAPIRGMFQKQGLFNDRALIVASGVAYLLDSTGALTTLSGVSIAGDDLVDIDGGLDADYNSIVRIATGSALYKISSADNLVVQESFPTTGGAGATSVAFVSGYWLAVEAGTDALYYQIPAATTWNALQFASAEYAPDALRGVRQLGDQFLLLGDSTTEIWYVTGDSADPLLPLNLKMDFGCRSRPTAVNCQGALIWVDHNCQVRMSEGGEGRIISDNGLAEEIRRVSAMDLRASFFMKDGHPLYVLTLGTRATWAYDLSTKAWTRFSSLGYAYWRAHLFANIGDLALAADALSHQVWKVDPDRRTDGSDSFTMEFCGLLPAAQTPIPLGNIVLDCELGGAPLTGQGSDPKVVMQLSTDAGKTYGTARERGLGATGEYTIRPRWNALGQTRPGIDAIAKFYISDPVVRRVSGAWANVP